MKLHFLKEDALYYLKSNIDINEKNYSLPTNDWIYESFDGENPFCEFKIEVEDFTMITEAERPESTDVQNAKIVYNALKNITDSQATDERLWSGLEHGQLWDYMQYRLKTSKGNLTTDSIKTNYFFKQGANRSLIVNTVSRLWWVGKHTYDKTNTTDPFYSMKYFEVDFTTKILTLFSSNFTNNPKITRALLNGIVFLEDDGAKVSREQYHSLIRYVNMLGGTYILDYLTTEELQEKIIRYYKSTYKSQQIIFV